MFCTAFTILEMKRKLAESDVNVRCLAHEFGRSEREATRERSHHERVRDAGSKLPQEVRLSLDPAALAPGLELAPPAAAPAEAGATPAIFAALERARSQDPLEPPPACPGTGGVSPRMGPPKGSSAYRL